MTFTRILEFIGAYEIIRTLIGHYARMQAERLSASKCRACQFRRLSFRAGMWIARKIPKFIVKKKPMVSPAIIILGAAIGNYDLLIQVGKELYARRKK